uniref:hypothetical protein n=1 Tax=Chitinimonas sp. TaxID=1934313 RepID=UPI0035B050D4
AGKPVNDAVVYVETAALKVGKSKQTVAIDQVNKEFTPLVTVVQTGTTVRFPNKDNIRHHIYSFSSGNAFDRPLYSGSEAKPVVFDKAGVVVLGCNIHDWMLAYALVVDTPYFGKSDSHGQVKIDELPAGDYEVKVWHPYQSGEAAAQKIKLAGDMHLAFQLKLTPPPQAPRTPLDRKGGRY